MGLTSLLRWSAVCACLAVSGQAWAQSNGGGASGGAAVYRCPGNIYTDALSPQEAKDKGCRTLEGAPITIVQGTRPRTTAAAAPSAAPSGPRPADSKVEPGEQRTRDNDARRILENELRTESERLVMLQKEFNNGEPERRGDERNYQKYQERVAEMKASIARKESDIAALKRELAKLPQ
jgi:hypothetical protein